MTKSLFHTLVLGLGALFTLAFGIVVVPELIAKPDILGAFAAGFVNPFASGYAMDAITTWAVLSVWVIHEARTKGIKHGWVAVALGVVPGVAVGLAAYLVIRSQDNATDGA